MSRRTRGEGAEVASTDWEDADMAEVSAIADLVRLKADEDGLVRVDDQLVDTALILLGLDSDDTAARVREILLTVIEDLSDEPLSIRVGKWSVRLPPDSFVHAMSSAVVVRALESAGVTNVPVIVLAAVAPFLVQVDKARVDVTDRVMVADLRAETSDEPGRRRSWADLPDDIRHEVPYTTYVDLVERLQGATTRESGGVGVGGGQDQDQDPIRMSFQQTRSSMRSVQVPLVSQRTQDHPD